MATISKANALAILDRVAAQAVEILSTFGADGSESGSIGESAIANRTAILGLGDVDQEYDLLGPSRLAVGKVLAANIYSTLKGLIQALNNHTGGLNSFLSTNDARLHYLLGSIVSWLAPASLFPPVVDPIATFSVTGAGAGTYTHVEDIDTTKYGKANLVLETTAIIGAGSLVATVTCVKIGGTTENKDVTVTNASPSGTKFDVGTHDTDMYVGVSGISITGGVAGDNFKITSEIERAVSM